MTGRGEFWAMPVSSYHLDVACRTLSTSETGAADAMNRRRRP
jgi:hypothetical protein